MKIIYYYQTFCGLKNILNDDEKPDIIHLSSIHFGENYIHLNNYPPLDSRFDDVWNDCKLAVKQGIKIVLMIGGAGTAYNVLFSDYKKYYTLLKNTLNAKFDIISGIDLDIEEEVDLSNIKMLMRDLKKDYPNFTISMAPIQSSLENDSPGMGGFIYKDLWNSPEGKLIDYFNGQFYGDFDLESYNACIKNGYPPEKVVIGMLSSQDFDNALVELKKIKKMYPSFGGVFNWEYYSSPPNPNVNPNLWCKTIKETLKTTSLNSTCYQIQ